MITMLTLEETPTHYRLEVDGAAFAIPIEVVRGIKLGLLPDDKYQQAAMFLSVEAKQNVSKEDIKLACESKIGSP